jgi:hypothetical protein
MIDKEIKELKAAIREYEYARELAIALSQQVYNPLSLGIYHDIIERCDQHICNRVAAIKLLEGNYVK